MYICRRRTVVSDVEVELSVSDQNKDVLALADSVFRALNGKCFPANIQIMMTDNGPKVIEVNPRFGGGVIHAIKSGLNFPQYVIDYVYNRSPYFDKPNPMYQYNKVMSRYRAEVFY